MSSHDKFRIWLGLVLREAKLCEELDKGFKPILSHHGKKYLPEKVKFVEFGYKVYYPMFEVIDGEDIVVHDKEGEPLYRWTKELLNITDTNDWINWLEFSLFLGEVNIRHS